MFKHCPRCRDEFVQHVETCPDCRVPLVTADALEALPAAVDGTSIVAFSVSSVISAASIATVSPAFTVTLPASAEPPQSEG